MVRNSKKSYNYELLKEMLLKGGFSEQEITDAKRYIEFGKDYNKPSPFTKIFEISKRLFLR